MPPPPPAVDPAYAAETNFPMMMGVEGTLMGLAIVFVALRTYARLVIVKSFGWDDAMMLLTLALVFGGGMLPHIIAGTHGSLGRHYDAVSKAETLTYTRMGFIQGITVTITSICCLKFSVGLSLLRLSSSTIFYTRILWSLMGFITIYMIMGWVSILAHCHPMEKDWNKDVEGYCYPAQIFHGFAAANTILNMITDIAFATLPVRMIWSLQMKQRQRTYLIFIFSLGYIAVAMGIAKLVFQLTTRGERDKSFNNSIQFFGFMQQCVGIVAACSPMLKPLFGRRLQLTEGGYSGPSDYHGSQRYAGYAKSRQSTHGYMRSQRGDFELKGLTGFHSRDTEVLRTIKAGGSRTGSEDDILGFDRPGHASGIMKTTEVHVS